MSISSRGYICGLQIDALSEGDRKLFRYVAKSAVILEESQITLKKGEFLRKVLIGYTDTAICGLQFFSDTQKMKIGEIDKCDHQTEADFSESETAIIGFDACFSPDRLVELSLFSAPLQKKAKRMPLTKPYLNGSSFALVNEDFYKEMKQKTDQNLIKSVFKESKDYRRFQSL